MRVLPETYNKEEHDYLISRMDELAGITYHHDIDGYLCIDMGPKALRDIKILAINNGCKIELLFGKHVWYSIDELLEHVTFFKIFSL